MAGPPVPAPPVPARRPAWPWVLVTIAAAVAIALVATGLWARGAIEASYGDARAVTAEEQAVVAGALAAASELAAQLQTQRSAYREAADAWDEGLASVELWRQSDVDPVPEVSNPGGTQMPGSDPYGRAFLDSIGAADVEVIFEAGPENCGFDREGAADPWLIVWGGCYSTQYQDWLFLAWESGAGDGIWATFVHEAMHWYQYEHYFPVFLAAERMGIGTDQYREQLETDASCRAVFVHGIPRSAYRYSSSPCTLDVWYEGWLVDQLAAMGVPTAAPVAEDYEVREVVRP